MEKILMHKNTPVAVISFKKNGNFEKIKKLVNPELYLGHSDIPEQQLRRFLNMRRTPASRNDVAEMRYFYEADYWGTEKSTLASLEDCFWFKTSESQTWESENLFDNWDDESDHVLLSIFRPEEFLCCIENSPNFMIRGADKRFFIKNEDGFFVAYTEPQKQMMLLRAAKKFEVEDRCLPRKNAVFARNILTIAPLETTPDVEKIPLDALYYSFEPVSDNKMENLEACFEMYGIKDWKSFLLAMCNIDEELGNDRDLNDIALIRDSNTLKFKGFAKL